MPNKNEAQVRREQQTLSRRKQELETVYRSLLGDPHHISDKMLRVVTELLQTKERLWEIHFESLVWENLDLEVAVRSNQQPVLQPLGPHRRN